MCKKFGMLVLAGFMILGLIAVCGAENSPYPAGPISIIVPYAAGSATDVNARVIEKFAAKYLGVPVAIINKPGAGGAVGYTELANAKPDGYTIGYTNLPNMVQLALAGNVQFKIEDFTPIIGQVKENKIIAVTTKSKFNSIDELVDYAKKNPESLIAATSGPGSHNELVLNAFAAKAGIKMILVPFKGDSAMKAALLGDHAQVMASGTSGFDAVQFKPLMICSANRDEDMPDVPTSFEKGFNLDMAASRVIQAPKDVPAEVVAFLEEKLKLMFADPEYLEDMKKVGAKSKMLTREEVGKLIVQEKDFCATLK